jgi:predicted thioesterase
VAIEPGAHASVVRRVMQEDTARALGSGDLEVLGTPRLVAWCEQATVAAVAEGVDAARTTVGTRVEIAHERASPVGATLTVRADLVHADGRLLRFEVVAEQEVDGASAVVGRGEVTRVVVDRDRFLSRL